MNFTKTYTLTILLVCVSGLLASKPNLDIRYLGMAEVETDQITLGDVTEFSLENSKIKKLKKQEVGRSANYGRTRYLSTASFYKKFFAPLEKNFKVNVKGPSRLKVTTASRTLEKERVFELVRDYVSKNRTPSFPEFEFEITAMPKTIHVPVADYHLELVSTGAAPLKGLHKLHLQINSAGKVQRKVPINIFIRHFQWVWVAEKKISRGVKISEADLRKERRDITKVPGVPIENIKQLRGSRSRQVIIRGRILTNKLLQLQRIVKQGDRVQVAAVKNGITIIMEGIARQDGVIGQTIRVKNLSTHALLKARVREDGTLEFVSKIGNG